MSNDIVQVNISPNSNILKHLSDDCGIIERLELSNEKDVYSQAAQETSTQEEAIEEQCRPSEMKAEVEDIPFIGSQIAVTTELKMEEPQHREAEKQNEKILTGGNMELEKAQISTLEEYGKLDEAAGGSHDDIELIERNNNLNLYEELRELLSDQLVIHPDKFLCPLCTNNYEENEGIILQECLHVFCRNCLLHTIKSNNAEVLCPFKNEDYSCEYTLLECEIKCLLSPEEYEERLEKTLAFAENYIENIGDTSDESLLLLRALEESKKYTALTGSNSVIGQTAVEYDKIGEAAGGNNESTQMIKEDEPKLYKHLTELSSDHLVIYPDKFECPICICDYEEMEGVILHDCLHVFCRDCLIHTIELSEAADVACPFRNEEYTCSSALLEYEIKALLSPEAYEIRLSKTLALAEASMVGTFHCKTPDCGGWCINDGSQVFCCPVCSITNCINCKAIHEGITCSEYQIVKDGGDVSAKMSEAALRDMVASGVAMKCPKCNGVITKQTGCDSLTCTFCRAQLCWATKGLRWGPNGIGDTSAGCRCNVNGIKCHPLCSNCH